MIIKDECINCKDKALNDRLNILEAIIGRNIINIDINPRELIYLLYSKYDNDLNKMLLDLGVMTPGTEPEPEPAK